MASPSLSLGQMAKEMLSPWTRGTGQACFLPRHLPQRGAHTTALVFPSCQLGRCFHLSAEGVGDTCLATGLLFVPRQAILLPERFPTPRPTAPSLLRGRRTVPSPHMHLGSAMTDVCNHASLSGRRDARAKSISLHAGIFHRAAGTSSGMQQQHPQTQLRFPDKCCHFPG